MTINTPIDNADWQEFFVLFSNGNRGREISIEEFDTESGSTGQARQGRLMAVDYDPVGKGNDIVITTGTDAIDYSHTIKAPVQVVREQLDNGVVNALQIIDQNNIKTVLSF
jgi:hypothetical protein